KRMPEMWPRASLRRGMGRLPPGFHCIRKQGDYTHVTSVKIDVTKIEEDESMSTNRSRRLSRRRHPRLECLKGRTLLTTVKIPDHAGNTLALARNLGSLTAGRALSYRDFVGAVDTQDFYKFRVGSALKLKLVLSGLGADADLQLLSSGGRVLKTS